MKLLAAEVGQCMNEKVRTSGCSAYQWVFGKNPRVPCDLLSPDGKLEALQGLDHDAELRLRAWIRAQADSKLAEFRTNEALRNAVLRMPRPPRPGGLLAQCEDSPRETCSSRLVPSYGRGPAQGRRQPEQLLGHVRRALRARLKGAASAGLRHGTLESARARPREHPPDAARQLLRRSRRRPCRGRRHSRAAGRDHADVRAGPGNLLAFSTRTRQRAEPGGRRASSCGRAAGALQRRVRQNTAVTYGGTCGFYGSSRDSGSTAL